MTARDASETSENSIVVGVDGSPGSRHALEWLTGQHALLGSNILPVGAFGVPATADGISPLGHLEPPEKYRAEAEAHLTNSVKIVDANLAQGAKMILEGHPGSVLVSAANKHSMLVVGCRGRSALTETLLGSVGSYCVKHSEVPVIIVPQEVPLGNPVGNIIVGVDGSPNAQAALQWAVDHASPASPVVAVGAFSVPTVARLSPGLDTDAMEAQCRHMVESSVAQVKRSEDHDAPVIVEIHEGDPRIVLRERATVQDLLVVGARGHEGVAHLILGSVATSLTHHPTVTTVVVPRRRG